MQIYTSTHSAADFEKAMGNIVTVGANGNWFLGGEDTGVRATGATNAEVVAALQRETWIFTLTDGTTVEKVVPLL